MRAAALVTASPRRIARAPFVAEPIRELLGAPHTELIDMHPPLLHKKVMFRWGILHSSAPLLHR